MIRVLCPIVLVERQDEERFAAEAEESKIAGSTVRSQASPEATGQSCMSLHRSGTMNARFGVVDTLARSVARSETA